MPIIAIQVAWTLDDDRTKKRELPGLIDACKSFGLKDGLIVTTDMNKDMKLDGINVKIHTLVRWPSKNHLITHKGE